MNPQHGSRPEPAPSPSRAPRVSSDGRAGGGGPRRIGRERGLTLIAEPRPELRGVAPYLSPQHDVVARLNTNECPHPLPEQFTDELSRVVRDLTLNRYPDGHISRLREDLAAHAGHTTEGTWAANGSNEILAELLLAYGGPGRRALTFEPTYLLYSRLSWLTHTEVVQLRMQAPFEIDRPTIDAAVATNPTSSSSARRTTRPATRSRSPPSNLAAEVPAASSSSTRRTSSSADVRQPLARPPPERRRRAHDVEGVRARRRADRLLPDLAGRGRGPPARAAALPRLRAHPGGRDHRARTTRRG